MYPGERLNSLTHLVGAALAATGTAVLVVLATRLGGPWKIVSFSIYGAMLVLLYAASTAYHSVRARRPQNLFEVFSGIALECNRDEWMQRMRRMGSCPCKQPRRPIARFHSNPSGKCLAGRSAALRRLWIAELSTAHRALHPIPARDLCDPEKILNRFSAVLQKLDHCSIYLLIGGSYTPFALVSLRGVWGWSLLGVVWGLAALGVVQEIWLARGARILSLVLYVAMGWLALVAVVPLWRALSPAGFAWLAAGGAAYTLGVAFYAADHRIPHGHGLWHLFVLAGSACHFTTVLCYVA